MKQLDLNENAKFNHVDKILKLIFSMNMESMPLNLVLRHQKSCEITPKTRTFVLVQKSWSVLLSNVAQFMHEKVAHKKKTH